MKCVCLSVDIIVLVRIKVKARACVKAWFRVTINAKKICRGFDKYQKHLRYDGGQLLTYTL